MISETRHPVEGALVHRLALSTEDVLIRGGLPLTSPPRTAVDCLAVLPHKTALALWAWLLTRAVLMPDDLARAVRQRLGQVGTPNLLHLLSVASGGAASMAERRMHDLLRRSGITGWTPNVPISDGHGVIGVVDILFASARVVVEIDGWASHGDRGMFLADRRRQNRLVDAGYVVLRFTWDDLESRPGDVVARIRRAVAAGKGSAAAAR